MSTSINGYRAAMNLTTLHRLITNFRAEMLEVARAEKTRLVAELAAGRHDDRRVRETHQEPNALSWAWNVVEERGRKIETSGERDPMFDFTFEITAIPNGTASVCGTIHCDRPAWRERWLAIAGIDDFSYWDSTDRPEEIDAAEWRRRRIAWERLLPTGIPARHGFTAQLVPAYLRIEPASVIAALPDAEWRRRRLAKEIATSEKVKELGGIEDPDQGMRRVMDALRWITTEEGKTRVAAVADHLQIDDPLTEDMLRGRRNGERE